MKWNIILLVGILLLALGCVSQNNSGGNTGTGTPPSSSVTVNLKNTQFNPSTISLTAGGTIHFVNQDGFAHDVHITQNGQDVLPKTQLDSGQTLDVPIPNPGTYQLICDRHAGAGMTGTITMT